jgi:glycosyltransferase involved in cell wall biosynthesis
MRVLHIDTGLEWRGGQRQALTLHKGLLSHNIESLFLGNQAGELYQLCENNNEEKYAGFKFNGELSSTTHNEIQRVVDEFNPTIIHCHDSHSAKLGSRFHKSCTIFHTRRVSYPIKFLSRYFKYKNIDAHVCVSEDIRNYMKQYFSNTFTIHSCVDIKRFDRVVDKTIFDKNGDINIVYIGAFSNQKGVDVLIKAFSNIVKTHVNSVLHLVGDGELLKPMKDLAKSLNIDNNTIFYGARKDVENFYLNSDYVVCPSVSGEGSSGVIKEGMAAGKIVITSDLTANKELIDDGVNGIMFKTGDNNALTTVLNEVINKEIIIDHQKIKDKVSLFDCPNTIEQYITLYKRISGNK